MPTSIDDSELEDLTDSGSAVKERVPTCQQAVDIANKLIRDDVNRAARRLQVQGMFDGNAPKNKAQMAEAKRGTDSNINWKEFKGNIINAWNPFFDLVCEIPVCIDAQLDVPGLDSDTCQELMRGFAEYFHDMLFEWEDFDNMNQLRDLQMLLHGYGTLAWEDEYCPFPQPILASDFYVDSQTKATLSNCEVAMITSMTKVGNLWREIEDEKRAKVMGWNPEVVKNAIMNASTGQELQTMGKNWDRWQQMFKNGDIWASTLAKAVKLATLFVREMDGTITQQVFCYDEGDTTKTDFLYKKVSKYASWKQALRIFFYDIGSDGTFHSIKGLGTEIFPFCALSNKIRNNIADLVVTGIKPMFQPAAGGKIEDFQMVKLGGYNMIPQGMGKVDLDIGRNLEPALAVSRDFSNTLVQNTGSYSQADLAPPTVEETAKSAIIRATERAKLTKGSHNRFYRSLDGQYAEIWRRATRPDLKRYHLSKNPEVAELVMDFREKCHALCARLQVPPNVLQLVKMVKATRSIGLGSAAMRIEIANAIMEKWPYLPDEASRNNALRAYFSTITSYANVDAFAPPINARPKVGQDEWDATIENGVLNTGGEVRITPTQNPIIHLESHIASAEQDAEAVMNGELDPREAVVRLEAKNIHSWRHMALIQNNPIRKQEATDFADRLRQLGSLQDELENNIAAQDEAAAAEQPPPVDPDLVKVQGNLQLKEMKQRGDMELKSRKQMFDNMLKQRQLVADTTIKAAQTGAKIQLDRTSQLASNARTP